MLGLPLFYVSSLLLGVCFFGLFVWAWDGQFESSYEICNFHRRTIMKRYPENVQLKELIETVKSRREFITAGSGSSYGIGGAVGGGALFKYMFPRLPMVRLQILIPIDDLPEIGGELF